MNRVHILSGVACLSILLATGAMAEILGIQPGTSDNPKDNVPKEIQRDGGTVLPGGMVKADKGVSDQSSQKGLK